MDLTVIICTYNPRGDYLAETFSGLFRQTLPMARWELLVIDNDSTKTVPEFQQVREHPQGRIVREETLGLTAARIRGIAEARAPVLIFVDDDNILASDYLEQALRLSQDYAEVGVWSAGLIRPSYESEPAGWLAPFLSYLALIETEAQMVSRSPISGLLPIGAGMIVRRDLARLYAEQAKRDPLRLMLGRKGSSLAANEDTDLGIYVCQTGWACGRSPRLQLLHLIPARRTRPRYLIRLCRDICRSHRLLNLQRGLIRMSASQVIVRGLGAFCLVPFRLLAGGRGEALRPLIIKWGEWLALVDWRRLNKTPAP